MKILIILFLLSVYIFPAYGQNKIDIKVEKFVLKNGLTVLVHEDHSVPLISFQQWYRVGSSHEKPGRTGLAHFFEHLMFKGTEKYPEGELDRQIQMSGGEFNAYTTEDLTAYYINIPSNKLELVIDVESDRMRNLKFNDELIQREREVVKEERRMRVENSVMGTLFENLRTTVYKSSPYRWPVIGYMKDLNAATLKDFKKFYDSYYVPNNAVIVVAGDVSASRVKKLIEKSYGDIPAGEIPSFDPQAEATQKSPREKTVTKDVQSSTLAIVYRGADYMNKDGFALDYLATVLGGGDSSRIHKRLVYQNQLATSIGVDNSANRLGGKFNIILALRPGASPDRALQHVRSELVRARRELVTEDEMKKVRNTIVFQYVKGLETIEARASTLASYEVRYGDYRQLFKDYDEYQKVTREDILAVAKKYFVPSGRSVVKLVPGGQSK